MNYEIVAESPFIILKIIFHAACACALVAAISLFRN